MRHPEYNLRRACLVLIAAAGLGFTSPALAQSAVADDAPIVLETLSSSQLQDVVGPVALYPDDLLAVVLPASAYPLQIVQAARFLDELEIDDSLKPDPDWDESVVALLNYPDVLRMMNDDLDWTYDLGAAVVNQQPDVIAAIETFRDRAYDAGNLKSDERQRVEREDDRIVITPVEREVIYVPYYEPQRVVVVQREPVYHYYPRPYPLYYYPYPAYYDFHRPFFFGVTSVFQIGWPSRHVNIHLWNYASHPFYGRRYGNHFYYHHRYQPARLRYRPYTRSRDGYVNRDYRGDQWRPVPRRNVRNLGQNRQRASGISRSDYVTSFKPRDPRDRRVAATARSQRVTNTRSVAPKTRYRNDDATRTRAARSTTREITRQRSERVTTSTRRAAAAAQTRQTPRSVRTTETRQYQRSARATEPARQYRSEAPARERARTTTRQSTQRAPAAQPSRVQRSQPAAAARPERRQNTAPAQRERSRVQRNQTRSSREGRSNSRDSDSTRRDRR